VERRNQSIIGMVRSMLKAMSMSGKLWGEAVATAVFIFNRLPTQSVEGRTLYEVWHGSMPSVQFFRTFGCVAHIKQGNKQLDKLEDKSNLVVLIGYEPGSKAWRFFNPVTRSMFQEMLCLKRIDHGVGNKLKSVMMNRSSWSMSLLVVCMELGESGMKSIWVFHKMYPWWIRCTLLIHLKMVR
jgi:hypothetical protein